MQRPRDLGTAPYSFLVAILLALSSWLVLVSEFSVQPSTPELEAERLLPSTKVQRNEPLVSSALKPRENVVEPVGKVDGPVAPPKVEDPGREPPKRSVNPPRVFKGLYLSFWSTTVPDRVDGVIKLARNGSVNAVVIDVKDATGRVGFDTSVPEAIAYQARHRIIRDLGALVGRLQHAGLYVIARIVVFTDPKLAGARPELAVHSKSKLSGEEPRLSGATLWLDNRKLAWLDPAAIEVWDYNVAIAKDVLRSGVDELNFDYIRFPSDGELNDMYFPVWRGKLPRRQVIRSFFAYLRQKLPDARLSADLFGLATVNRDDRKPRRRPKLPVAPAWDRLRAGGPHRGSPRGTCRKPLGRRPIESDGWRRRCPLRSYSAAGRRQLRKTTMPPVRSGRSVSGCRWPR